SCITPTNRWDMWFSERSVKTTEYSSRPSGSMSSCGRFTAATVSHRPGGPGRFPGVAPAGRGSAHHLRFGHADEVRSFATGTVGARQPTAHHLDGLGAGVDQHVPAPEPPGHRPKGAAAGEEVQHPVAACTGGLHHPAHDALGFLGRVPGLLL